MSDTILAAWITGGLQASSAITAIIAAWIALNSWRRHALGNRQVALAEECLQAVWNVDEKISDARLLLPPGDIDNNRSDTTARDYYVQRHRRALDAMRECYKAVKALKKLFMLSELYLGEFPRIEFQGTIREFQKAPYSIQREYEEIVGQLLVALMEVSPETIGVAALSEKETDDFTKSANLFFGFTYEYETDEYSARLKLARQTFERHILNVLRRRSFRERVVGRLDHWVSDRYWRKFTPVTINKHWNWNSAPRDVPAVKQEE